MHPTRGHWRVFDMGCGSGLVGQVFKDLVNEVAKKHAHTADFIEDTDTGFQDQSNSTPLVDEHQDTELQARLQPSFYDVLHLLSLSYHVPPERSLLVGIDVSIKIAQIAEKTGNYDLVIVGDLYEALQLFNQKNTETRNSIKLQKFHAIIAADTFIYLGALGRVFQAIHRALLTNGLLIFSVEDVDESPMLPTSASSPILDSINAGTPNINHNEPPTVTDGEPWGAVPGWGVRLLTSARFGHSHRYIEALAIMYSFQIVSFRRQLLRKESNAELGGIFYILLAV